MLAAFVAGATAVAIIAAVVGGRGSQAGPSAFDPFVLDHHDPTAPLLTDGEKVSLAEADARTSFPIYRPQTIQASDQSMSDTWVGTGGVAEVALRYDSGLRAYLTLWPGGKSAAASYRQQVADSGVGTFAEINGNPAYVVAEDAQAKGFPPYSVVDVTIGGVEVSLQGHFSTDELRKIAQSLDA